MSAEVRGQFVTARAQAAEFGDSSIRESMRNRVERSVRWSAWTRV